VLSGLVLRSRGGVYDVETEEGIVDAVLRGRLKREERTGERVVVGDRVELTSTGVMGEPWTIESVAERSSALIRRSPGKAPRPKAIVANLDQVVIVFAAAHPDPHLRMLDRFLVLCEDNRLEAMIVANKVDIAGEDRARALFGPYREIGYPVIYTSAATGEGVDDLRESIRGKISALTGPSGVGKSSLLNRVQPGLGLRVGAVSEVVRKGRHTTVTAELIRLNEGGYVADTPGLRELGLWQLNPQELDLFFPEFDPYLGTCRYGSSCTHSHEPGCTIRTAVAEGRIHAFRYDSYLKMLQGELEEGDFRSAF
jgi:ribosome biogenesis GTPase / thiamine phosphate phosphatase